MKANLVLATLGLVVWLECVGCSKNPLPVPWDGSIELHNQFANMCGYRGETRVDTLYAITRDNDGVSIPGVSIDFQMRNPLSWKGTLQKVQQDTLSDENGVVRAIYQVTFTRPALIEIAAISRSVATYDTISLTLIPDSLNLSLLGWEQDDVIVPRDSTYSKQMVTTLIDRHFNRYPDVRLEFKPWPGTVFKGSVTPSVAVTNFKGDAQYVYTSEPNQYGDFVIMGCSFRDTMRTVIRLRER